MGSTLIWGIFAPPHLSNSGTFGALLSPVTDAPSKKSKAQGPDSDSDKEDNDYINNEAIQSDDVNEVDDNNEEPARDDPAPAGGRVRCVSKKQAQLFDEQKQAEARKAENAAKAVRAAKRAAGKLEEDRRPREDVTFTSRTIMGTRPTTVATKSLVQRDSRVPAAPKAPTVDHRRLRDSDSNERYYRHNDQGPGQEEEPHHTFRGRSPLRDIPVARTPIRNINGEIVPDRVTVQVVSQQSHHHEPSRSDSPDAGDEHRRSTSIDSDDLHTIQSPRIGTSSGRPRAKDLDSRMKEYTVFAIDLYRCYASAKDLFPDTAQEVVFAKRAWDGACEEFGERLPLSSAFMKLITNRGPHMRGELKTKLRPMAELLYSFKSGNNKKTILFNRQLAEDLKEGALFAFKDVKLKKGLFKAPILQRGANAMWFANRRDEGPSHPEFFNPFPYQAVAALLTVVENTIDEYLTGVRIDIPFTANDYRSVYATHLKSLKDFEAHTTKYGLLDKILTRMHNIGWFHSGAQPIAVVPTAILSKEVLEQPSKNGKRTKKRRPRAKMGNIPSSYYMPNIISHYYSVLFFLPD
ncbi:hypothetical protein DFH08DRAFT_979668 [Mycena albidolilacea]|uniref:DUF6532 domain-containing protein n=1 Tax=Mycena albidolilacea TaxID=1033008 RepID=A0AAD6YWB2_9AGAR|nr:hypothetical protein DFH08DRAFT_979668 [Mycena albidolilacea]